MNTSVLVPKECAKPLNDLARLQMITRLENDILMDLAICGIEGWSKAEYINQLRELVNGFNV